MTNQFCVGQAHLLTTVNVSRHPFEIFPLSAHGRHVYRRKANCFWELFRCRTWVAGLPISLGGAGCMCEMVHGKADAHSMMWPGVLVLCAFGPGGYVSPVGPSAISSKLRMREWRSPIFVLREATCVAKGPRAVASIACSLASQSWAGWVAGSGVRGGVSVSWVGANWEPCVAGAA